MYTIRHINRTVCSSYTLRCYDMCITITVDIPMHIKTQIDDKQTKRICLGFNLPLGIVAGKACFLLCIHVMLIVNDGNRTDGPLHGRCYILIVAHSASKWRKRRNRRRQQKCAHLWVICVGRSHGIQHMSSTRFHSYAANTRERIRHRINLLNAHKAYTKTQRVHTYIVIWFFCFIFHDIFLFYALVLL